MKRIEASVFVAVALVVSLGAWWWTGTAPPDETMRPTVSLEGAASPPVESHTVTVHVAGEVREPGVVELPFGARVVDAIEAAGGATASARLTALNLAAALTDGAQVLVPSAAEDVGVGATRSDGTVAVNRATPTELEALPGVGPVLASRIVEHREAHGPFQTAEDLLDVPGIGESILARLRPLVRIP
jgi:competence protein ComEA